MSRSDRLTRSMEAAAFFDRLALAVATSRRAETNLRRELPMPEQFRDEVRAREAREAEIEKGRRTIAVERERWLTESKRTA